MYENFTEKSIKVIFLAQEESRRLGHNFVCTEQILLGTIGEETGIAAKVLKSMGVNLKDARIEVEKIIGYGAGFVAVKVPFSPKAKRMLELAQAESRQFGHNYISTKRSSIYLQFYERSRNSRNYVSIRLSTEEQDSLIETIKKRKIERRRQEQEAEILASRQELKQVIADGTAKRGNAHDLIA